MCQLMIQCKSAIKPCLVTVFVTAVTGEGNFVVDIYKIFEHCLLSDCSSPRMFFSFILGVVFIDFILGMSFPISEVPTCQCFILQKPSHVHALKIVTRSETLGRFVEV